VIDYESYLSLGYNTDLVPEAEVPFARVIGLKSLDCRLVKRDGLPDEGHARD
jgi:hypothetical protein